MDDLGIINKILDTKDFSKDGIISSLFKEKRRSELSELEKLLKGIGETDSLYSTKIALVEFIAIASSFGMTLTQLSGKRVLVIGSATGEEVLLLRLFGIDSYGVENEKSLHEKALQKADLYSVGYQDIFFNDNAVQFMLTSGQYFDLVLARNLNPLALAPEIIGVLKNSIRQGMVNAFSIQWDAIFLEKVALSLYSPKEGVIYNKKQHELLDSFHKNVLNEGRIRARFLYKMGSL